MKKTLAELASAFTVKDSAHNENWKLYFPFWKAAVDSTSIVRFLPDVNDQNPLGFLVENHAHELHINGKRETVPCLKMYGEDCPICALSEKYYAEQNKTMGKKFYRKKSYIGQVLIIETPLEHDQETLVKLIEFGPKIFSQIQAAFQSGDLEEAPYEYKGGYNFRIKKTKSGEFADYGTSNFSPKPTNVADDVIDKLQLFNLSDYRTPRVTREVLEAMLLAAQTGSTFKEEDSGKPETPADPEEKKLTVVEQLRKRAEAAKNAA